MIQKKINLYNNRGSINDIEVSIRDVNNFVESLLMERNVIMYKQEIAKIIKGRMSGKMLNDLYRNMKIRPDNFSKINEGFYNPFDEKKALQDCYIFKIALEYNQYRQYGELRIVNNTRNVTLK